MRLIDVETLKSRIGELCINNDDLFSAKSYERIIGVIEAVPTIDAELVRHGYWIECDYKHIEHGMIETEPKAGLCCSECRTAFQKKKMTNKQYCAACGAKMDADHIADGSKKVGGAYESAKEAWNRR